MGNDIPSRAAASFRVISVICVTPCRLSTCQPAGGCDIIQLWPFVGCNRSLALSGVVSTWRGVFFAAQDDFSWTGAARSNWLRGVPLVELINRATQRICQARKNGTGWIAIPGFPHGDCAGTPQPQTCCKLCLCNSASPPELSNSKTSVHENHLLICAHSLWAVTNCGHVLWAIIAYPILKVNG